MPVKYHSGEFKKFKNPVDLNAVTEHCLNRYLQIASLRKTPPKVAVWCLARVEKIMGFPIEDDGDVMEAPSSLRAIEEPSVDSVTPTYDARKIFGGNDD